MTTAQSPVETMPQQNLYRVLNLPQTASADELKKAINRELRLWSNRTNAPQIERRQEAERTVKLLEQAETILLDPANRTAYDRQLVSSPDQERQVVEGDLTGTTDLIVEAKRLLNEGHVADALFVADKATQKEGGNPEAWAVLAKAQHQWGDTDDAVASYRRAIKLRPNEAMYYYDLGCIYESVGKANETLQQWQRAAQIEPATTMYRAGVGATLAENGQPLQGIEILEQCGREQPDNAVYQWFLARAYKQSAFLGWTFVPEGRQDIPSDWYATEYKHVIDAQAALDKAMSLKFDDPELTEDLQNVRRYIDSNLKRRIMCKWTVAVIVGLIGIPLMFIPTLLAILYVISSRVPQYKINNRVVQGKQFNEFAFLGGMFGNDVGIVGVLIMYAIIIVLMPFVVIINFIRNYAIK